MLDGILFGGMVIFQIFLVFLMCKIVRKFLKQPNTKIKKAVLQFMVIFVLCAGIFRLLGYFVFERVGDTPSCLHVGKDVNKYLEKVHGKRVEAFVDCGSAIFYDDQPNAGYFNVSYEFDDTSGNLRAEFKAFRDNRKITIREM